MKLHKRSALSWRSALAAVFTEAMSKHQLAELTAVATATQGSVELDQSDDRSLANFNKLCGIVP